MNFLADSLKQLVALTQLHVLQEYSMSERLQVELESFLYFREHFTQKKPQVLQKAQEKSVNPPSLVSARENTSQTPQTQPKPQPVKMPAIVEVAKQAKEQPIVNPIKTDKEQKDDVFFALEPPSLEIIDLKAMRRTILEQFPKITVIDPPPKDGEALVIGRSWEQMAPASQVIMLSFEETTKHRLFLTNIVKALNVYEIDAQLIEARKIEQANGWEGLLQSEKIKLFIAPRIHSLPGLLKCYREEPNQARHYLGKVPLLLLSDLTLYIKEPSLKHSLWKAIHQLLV